MRLGRQADLARELGISRAAVSQAFRKHNMQLSMDGKFDLDYAAWLLKEKQNQIRSKAQRSANKQPPGVKNPRVRREVLRLLYPIWNRAVIETLRNQAETSFSDDSDIRDLMESYLTLGLFWSVFHRLCEGEFPAELTNFPYKEPELFQVDIMSIDEHSFIENILGRRLGDEET